MTTAMLEERTGVPRTTIRFYVRQGLLPEPHKTASGRSLFSEHHVALLHKISELKDDGLSLSDIEVALEQDLSLAEEATGDLAEREQNRVHAAILRTATEEFAANGYKGTHISAIVKKLGITPYVFYSHFPSKLQLLVECFDTFIRWNLADTRPRVLALSDPTERDLLRSMAGMRVAELAADLSAVLRLEGRDEAADPYRLFPAWQVVIERSVEEFMRVLPEGAPPPVELDLLAHSFIGAFRQTVARTTWDDRFTLLDVLRVRVFHYRAVIAALQGETDAASAIPDYEEFIQDLVSRGAHLPPPL